MKKSLIRSRSSGFTLVELLVVIAIIAILAAVVLSAGSAALRAANRAKAGVMANQLQTAALNYYTEYSVYPVPSSFAGSADFYISDATSDKANWGNWIEAMCGNISPHSPGTTVTPTVPNTRVIAFLQLKAGDVDANDAPLNPLPFSTSNPYFNIGIDDDYTGIVGNSGTIPGSGIPDFTASTLGTIKYLQNGASGGVIVWANCNTSTVASQQNPNYYVHTY